MFSFASRTSSARYIHARRTDGPRLAAFLSFTPHFRPRFNELDDDVSRQAVLIFSSDPLAAALLGAVVELAEHTPNFARHDEPARSALLRVRPRLVLIDCDHDESCCDEFIGPALMTGAQILLFRSYRTRSDRDTFAARLSLRIMDMPADHNVLTTLLTTMIAE